MRAADPPFRFSSGIRLVHCGNLSRNGSPFEFAPYRFPALLLLHFVPLQKLIRKAEMRLDDHIETTGSDETAGRIRGE